MKLAERRRLHACECVLSICTALITLLFPAVASANYPHVVQPGETLTSVAATDGLSVEAIAAANGISAQAQLVTGRVLWIPPRSLASNVSTDAQTQSDPDSDRRHGRHHGRGIHHNSGIDDESGRNDRCERGSDRDSGCCGTGPDRGARLRE